MLVALSPPTPGFEAYIDPIPDVALLKSLGWLAEDYIDGIVALGRLEKPNRFYSALF